MRVLAVGCLLVGVLVGCEPAPLTRSPRCSTAQDTSTTASDTGLTERAHAYFDSNVRTDDATGVDGAHAVVLPDGRRLWGYGDTFLGTVTDDHARASNTRLIVGNTYIEESSSGTFVRTLTGGTAASPTAFLRPATPGHWYWPGDAVVEGNKLRVLVNEWSHGSVGGTFDWIFHGTGIVTLSLPGLTVDTKSPQQVTMRAGMTWTGLLEQGDTTYIYGHKDKELYVARRPRGLLLGPWEYRGPGGTWSTDPAVATPILGGGVVDSAKVVRSGSCYLLITFAPGFFFNTPDVRVYYGDHPDGPWGAGQPLYTIPEGATSVDTIWYGARPESALSGGSNVGWTYSVNAFAGLNYTDVHKYRPRFMTSTISSIPAPTTTTTSTTSTSTTTTDTTAPSTTTTETTAPSTTTTETTDTTSTTSTSTPADPP
jgi:hypothetical protein